jgi:CHAT domain-containing protein
VSRRHRTAAAVFTFVSVAAAASGQVGRGPWERQIAGSGSDTIQLQIPEGYFIRIEVLQKGRDLTVALRDPPGEKLFDVDSDNADFGPETVVAIAESGGEYLLEIRNGDRREGSYEARIAELRTSVAADRDVIAAHRNYAEGVQLHQQRTAEARRQSIDKLKQAIAFFEHSEERYMNGLSLYSLGAVQGDDGRFQEALAHYERAAAVFRGLSDSRMEAKALNNEAGALTVLGEPIRALTAYRQSLVATQAFGDRSAEANLLNNIAVSERTVGEWQASLRDYQRALELARAVGDKKVEANVLSNTGVEYRELGEGEQAIDLFSQALALRRAAGDKRGEATTLIAMAEAQRFLLRPEKALEYAEQALAPAKALGDRRLQASDLELQGLAYTDLKRFEESQKALQESLALAQAVQDRPRKGHVFVSLAHATLLAGQPEKAADWSAQAISEFRAMGDRSSEGASLEIAARAESARGNLTEARRLIEEALRLNEDARKGTDSQQLRASFFATRQDAYAFYVDLLMRSGAEAAALEANERAHARSLLEMLADTGSAVRAGADPALLDRERDISNRINAKGAQLLPIAGTNNPRAAALTAEIRQLETEYQDVQAAIRKSSPRYAALTQPSPLTAAQIQTELLDQDSMLLEYSLGEERSYVWVVERSGLRAFTLPPRARIEEQVRKVLQMVTSRTDTGLPAALRELRGMVLGDASPFLGGKRLVFVPDGALQNLPFAMLPESGSDEPLVVRHEVVMEPSASAMAAVRQQLAGRKEAPRMLAVFADPVFGPEDPRAGGRGAAATPASTRILEHLAGDDVAGSARLKIPRLPYTAQEADQILNVARGASNLRAVGFEANRATATSGQLSDFRYLHFATHGYLDTERPSLSALVLSQIDVKGQPQDGFLRVDDIYNARLSADLVVLSACQTGLGKEVRGEGLMGLTRAFLYAGVPRVIVSLWNVNDRATAELMASLYRDMLREGKRPSEALREAQLELRKKKRWESPFYWAAFVQHGEWQ